MQAFVHCHEQHRVPNVPNKKLAIWFPDWNTLSCPYSSTGNMSLEAHNYNCLEEREPRIPLDYQRFRH